MRAHEVPLWGEGTKVRLRRAWAAGKPPTLLPAGSLRLVLSPSPTLRFGPGSRDTFLDSATPHSLFYKGPHLEPLSPLRQSVCVYVWVWFFECVCVGGDGKVVAQGLGGGAGGPGLLTSVTMVEGKVLLS